DLDHRDYEKELRHADMQVLTTSIPAEYIIAVIKISDNQRLLPHIRPNKKRGETQALQALATDAPSSKAI
ncbi:MAG: hypothetical protein ACPGWR_31245, partial [Ardenticatenaceae bacterium]